MWQAIATLSVPIISFLGVFLGGGSSRLSKRISHHADLLAKVKGAKDATAELEALLGSEARKLREREEQRTARRLNKSNLAAAIFVTVTTAVLVYVLVNWVTSTWGTPLAFVSTPALALVGLFGIALAVAGFATIFDAPKTPAEKAEDKARREARQAARRSV